MSTNLNNDNDHPEKQTDGAEVNNNEPPIASDANSDDAYKPSVEHFKAEQQAIKEAINPKSSYKPQVDDLYIDHPEESEENERFKPGYIPKEKEPDPIYNVSQSVQSDDIKELEAIKNVEHKEKQAEKPTSPEKVPKEELEPENKVPIEERIAQSLKQEKDQVKPPEIEDKDTRFFCGVCHLCNPLIITIGWVPFLLYLTKADDYKVRFHAMQSFLFGVSVVLVFLILKAISLMLVSVCMCLVLLIPAVLLFVFVFWIYAIHITLLVFHGNDTRIPYICDIADWLYDFLHR